MKNAKKPQSAKAPLVKKNRLETLLKDEAPTAIDAQHTLPEATVVNTPSDAPPSRALSREGQGGESVVLADAGAVSQQWSRSTSNLHR